VARSSAMHVNDASLRDLDQAVSKIASGKTMAQVFSPKLSPSKGRWPKSDRKQAFRRYLLSAAAEWKQARIRRDGSQGAKPSSWELSSFVNVPSCQPSGRVSPRRLMAR
jgi:hypothetical protein